MNRSEIIYRDVVLQQIPKDSMLQQFIQDLKPFILSAMEDLAKMAYEDLNYQFETKDLISFTEWINEDFN